MAPANVSAESATIYEVTLDARNVEIEGAAINAGDLFLADAETCTIGARKRGQPLFPNSQKGGTP